MPELTNEDKAVLNCLFRALNQKNKGYTSIKAVKELVDLKIADHSGLIGFESACLITADDEGVKEEMYENLKNAKVSFFKEENTEKPEPIENSKPKPESKPIEKEETDVKPMEQNAIKNQNEEKETQTYDISKIPTTQEQLDKKRKIEEENRPKSEKILIKGDAIIKKVALEVGTKDQVTKNENIYRDYLLAITYVGLNGEGEVTERYAGITGWLNNGILSEPQFDSTRGTKVASIFKEFVEVSGINPEEIDAGLHLGLLLQYLNTNPKVQLKPKQGKFTNQEKKEVTYTKNEIIQFYK